MYFRENFPRKGAHLGTQHLAVVGFVVKLQPVDALTHGTLVVKRSGKGGDKTVSVLFAPAVRQGTPAVVANGRTNAGQVLGTVGAVQSLRCDHLAAKGTASGKQ